MFSAIDAIPSARFLKKSAINFLATYYPLSIFAVATMHAPAILKVFYGGVLTALVIAELNRIWRADIGGARRIIKRFSLLAVLVSFLILYVPLFVRNVGVTLFAVALLFYNAVFVGKFFVIAQKLKEKE